VPGGRDPVFDYVDDILTTLDIADDVVLVDRALELATELGKGLVVLEGLRCGYPWASDRLHAFVLAGMADNAEAFRNSAVRYYPYVEPEAGAGSGLLVALAGSACVVVGDDYPTYFLPRMLAAAGEKLPCRLELVDSNGLLPASRVPRAFPTAYSFRRFVQLELGQHLRELPRAEPLTRVELPKVRLSRELQERWPAADERLLAAEPGALARLPIDHDVQVAELRGGAVAGRRRMTQFIKNRLASYDDDRNHPDEVGATSGLSPYLHFGHVASAEVFVALMRAERWSTDVFPTRRDGRRGGWGVSPSAEAWLDQLVTWREVGFARCWNDETHASYEGLPGWARETLEEHESDPRWPIYTLEEFEAAATHDALWNAAQRQLLHEGVLHNYLRMLWGKKILEWSETPREALATMLELNDRFALDGRDPNSYCGITWVMGSYDRAWGPVRPVFGKVRYMSSENAARKLRLDRYLERHGERRSTS
ncbi:MAG: deoxyribodipyrimidine photolyase, partial [Acidobacteriota bacterium]